MKEWVDPDPISVADYFFLYDFNEIHFGARLLDLLDIIGIRYAKPEIEFVKKLDVVKKKKVKPPKKKKAPKPITIPTPYLGVNVACQVDFIWEFPDKRPDPGIAYIIHEKELNEEFYEPTDDTTEISLCK